MSNDPDQSPFEVSLAGNEPGIGVGDSWLGQGWSWVDFQTGAQTFTPEGLVGTPTVLIYSATF